ncbi:chaperonin 10-like protein [Lipomyces arxii]|uniref:chaperonin 10-like protein n=1 Tax=Lipomyces arxii TaxID=56418 RepID=UPI0034CDA05B
MGADKFFGWVAFDKSAAKGHMIQTEFDVRPFTDNDIDLEIAYCGVCGSDIHTLRNGWGNTTYPIVVGHEIVGKVIKKGANVKQFEIGDRVGVGAQCDSCLKCDLCKGNNEQYCGDMKFTYGGEYGKYISQGGYALNGRYPASFAFKLPKSIPSEIVAPMMCAGVTTYSPLKRHGAGPGKTVGVIGIGGLGHFGLMFAKALGCDKVVAISRSRSKEADARKLGATDFIATGEKNWLNDWEHKIDIIINTANIASMPTLQYLLLLKIGGSMVQLGIPEAPLENFLAFPFAFYNANYTGSTMGSRKDIEDMLALAAKDNIKSWVQIRPMSEANDVIQAFEAGEPRYRYVLKN